jgi:hypothetical protein
LNAYETYCVNALPASPFATTAAGQAITVAALMTAGLAYSLDIGVRGLAGTVFFLDFLGILADCLKWHIFLIYRSLCRFQRGHGPPYGVFGTWFAMASITVVTVFV